MSISFFIIVFGAARFVARAPFYWRASGESPQHYGQGYLGDVKMRGRTPVSIFLVAGLLWGCSSPTTSNETASDSGHSMQQTARLMTYSVGFPPPARRSSGVFGLRNDCLVLQPETSNDWFVAVVPPGSSFTHDSGGAANGVVIDGRTAKFGEKIEFGGGVSPYALGEQGRACPGPTVIVGTIIGQEK